MNSLSSPVELRAIKQLPSGQNDVLVGYYDNPAIFAKHAAPLNDEGYHIYSPINLIKPEIASDVNQPPTHRDAVRKNGIARRVVLPYDVDVDRPKGQAASDAELKPAHEIARAIVNFWRERGVSPRVKHSGNGFQIEVPIDLPNDAASEELVKKVLETHKTAFDIPGAHIDCWKDANRIFRVPGYKNLKGDNSPERPQRIVKVLNEPSGEATREMLEEVAKSWVKRSPSSSSGTARGSGTPDQEALTVLKDAYLRSGRVWSALKAARRQNLKLNGDHSTITAFANFLNNSWEEGRANRDGIVRVLETIWDECGTSADGGRTENEVEDIVDHAFAKDRKPWVICDSVGPLDPPYVPPAAFVWTSRKTADSEGPLWVFSKEVDFALFKHRVEQTPAWAYAAEQKDPDGFWELPADYEAWRESQGNREDPRLLTHAALKAARIATPSPEIVEGLIPENSVNILVGDSGLGKTPFVVQLAVCIALGADFLGQKTVQKKVMMVDYENSEALADVVGQICEHLKLPSDFVMDPKWFRIVQNVDASEVLKLVQEFKPGFVVVDSLRGFCPTADTKNEIASKLITELQSRKASFLLMHHVRKNSTEKRDKRQALEKEERVLDWLEAAAGARALINQTYTRIAIDHIKADNADLVLRGFYKGRGEFGPWKLARNYSEQHGEPIGYDRLTGTALLDIEQNAFFDAIPKGQPMSYKEIQHSLGQSEGQITRFLAACDNAQVVVATGKRKTRSRRYTFLAEKKPPKSAEELEQEDSVREAFR